MRLRAISVAMTACVLFWALVSTQSRPVSTVAYAEEPATSPAGTAHPVPTEKTNCVACHLKAGGELTDAVHTFALSVHDNNGLSCNDCHGGNLEDDAKAHGVSFGFIGTKLSSHLKACAGCHEEPAAELNKGPHFWDHSAKLNIEYPLCIDCHGNHDVGNPPADFSLSLVCADCHEGYAEKFPEHAAITDNNDKLWESIRGWREAHPGEGPVPEALAEELGAIRTKTSALIHPAGKVSKEDAQSLNKQVEEFRKKLDEGTEKSAK